MFVSAHIAKMEFPGSPTTIEICVRCTARGVGVRPAVCWLAKANNLIGYVQRRSARPHQDNRRTDAHSPFLKLLRKTSRPRCRASKLRRPSFRRNHGIRKSFEIARRVLGGETVPMSLLFRLLAKTAGHRCLTRVSGVQQGRAIYAQL